jgi:hypothetical protein
MSYRYVKAPPGYKLLIPPSPLSQVRYILSLVLITLGIATFTTVAYPLVYYQIIFAPNFTRTSPISPSMINHVQPVKAAETPTVVTR